MISTCNRPLLTATLLLIVLFVNTLNAAAQSLSPSDLFGPAYLDATQARTAARARPEPQPGPGIVRRWNEITTTANAVDHASAIIEQPGPVRTARAFAIVHIAIYDAANAISGGHRSYTRIAQAPGGAAFDAAIAQAAHDTLAALYPSQQPVFDGYLKADLARIPNGRARDSGIALGQRRQRRS